MMPRHSALESPFLSDELLAPEPSRVSARLAQQTAPHSPFLALDAFDAGDPGRAELANETFDDEDGRIEAGALIEGSGLTERQEALFAPGDEGEAYVVEGARTSTAAADCEFDDAAVHTLLSADELETDLSEMLMLAPPEADETAMDGAAASTADD